MDEAKTQPHLQNSERIDVDAAIREACEIFENNGDVWAYVERIADPAVAEEVGLNVLEFARRPRK